MRARHAFAFPVRLPTLSAALIAGATRRADPRHGRQRSCSSELRRQTSGRFYKSDSARLTVCTGALCDRQPASATLPCPMTAPWLREMQCSPAVCSRGMQVRAVAELWGLRWHLSRSLSLNKCATHIRGHPTIPAAPGTTQSKNSMRACSFVSQSRQKQSI